MAPRITISTTTDGELEISVNEQGRDRLVRELQALSAKSDHFHLGSSEGAELELRDRAYRPTDTIIHAAKVLFRPDEWDRHYFLHVMEDPPEAG